MSKVELGPELSRAAALMQQNRLDQAVAVCQQVLKKNRRDFNAYQILGMIDSMRGRFQDAVAHFQKGLDINPRGVMLLCGLANARRVQGRYDDAIDTYDRALRIQPDYPPALTGKADVLEHLGDFDAARALLEPIVASGKAHGDSAVIFATLEQRAGRDEEAVALCRRYLDGGAIGAITRRKMLYCAGKSSEKLGRYDDAFAAYAEANTLLRQPFDIETVRRRFRRIREVFSRERLAGYARATITDELPVFIVSMPRVGSTLVEQILAAHPDVHGAGEIDEMIRRVKELPNEGSTPRPYPDLVATLDAAALDRLATRHLQALRRMDAIADRVVDKNLQNFRLCGLIALMLPGARVINVRRHPMATCFSCWTLPLSPVALPYTTDLRNLGLFYREYDRLMKHWFDVLDIELLEVHYEDLVGNQEAVSRRIIDFVGLPWNDACLRFHDTGREVATASYDQVRQPMYTSALRRYEPFGEHMAPLRDALDSD